MTFSLPEELADQLVQQVPSRERSRFLADVLRKSLEEQEEEIIRACKLANRDADPRSVEAEFDRIEEGIEVPWDDPEAP